MTKELKNILKECLQKVYEDHMISALCYDVHPTKQWYESRNLIDILKNNNVDYRKYYKGYEMVQEYKYQNSLA